MNPATDEQQGTSAAPAAAEKAQTKKETAKPQAGRKSGQAGKRDKQTKNAKLPKNAAAKREAKASARSNKKADVIAMMQRARGVTLAEIMESTGWQAVQPTFYLASPGTLLLRRLLRGRVQARCHTEGSRSIGHL